MIRLDMNLILAFFKIISLFLESIYNSAKFLIINFLVLLYSIEFV
jgi:hypothetical protein